MHYNTNRTAFMRSCTCAFTGPGPSNIPLAGKKNAKAPACLASEIENAIYQAVSDGFRFFVSGGEIGCDLWCAQCVLALKRERPELQLHFYLPCETQADDWPEHWRECYFDLLIASDYTTYIERRNTRECVIRRNRALVDASSRLIAVYDGIEAVGGTAHTVGYAEKNGVYVHRLWPFD